MGYLQDLAEFYRNNPERFTENDLAKIRDAFAAEGRDFNTEVLASEDSDFSLYRTASQIATGFLSGFTALPIGEEPRNTAEGIAHSIGHLAGFVGIIFPGVTAGKAASKGLGALSSVLRSAEFAAEARGAGGLGGFLLKSKDALARSASLVSKFRSVPMFAADFVSKGLVGTGLETAVMKKLATMPVAQQAAKQGIHLGVASAVSDLHRGLDDAVTAGVSGAMFGGLFASIGNLPFAGDSTTAHTVLKAIAGSLAQGAPSSIAGADVPTQVYNYLLGAYFGGTSQSVHSFKAAEYLSKFTSPIERMALHRRVTKDPRMDESFQELSPEARKLVIDQIEQLDRPQDTETAIYNVMRNLAINAGYKPEEVDSYLKSSLSKASSPIRVDDYVQIPELDAVPRRVLRVIGDKAYLSDLDTPVLLTKLSKVQDNLQARVNEAEEGSDFQNIMEDVFSEESLRALEDFDPGVANVGNVYKAFVKAVVPNTAAYTEGQINALATDIRAQMYEAAFGRQPEESKVVGGLERIISGGQTGADQGGLLGGKDLGIATGGIAPSKFATEKGSAQQRLRDLGLEEIDTATLTPEEQAFIQNKLQTKWTKPWQHKWNPRTYLNVNRSDGTILIGDMKAPGSILTNSLAKELGKPVLINPSASELRAWVQEHKIKTLNVAGNREGRTAGITEKTRNLIKEAFRSERVPEANPTGWQGFEQYLHKQALALTGKPLDVELLPALRQQYTRLTQDAFVPNYYIDEATMQLVQEEVVRGIDDRPLHSMDVDGNRTSVYGPRSPLHILTGDSEVMRVAHYMRRQRSTQSNPRLKMGLQSYSFDDGHLAKLNQSVRREGYYLYGGNGDKPQFIFLKKNVGDFTAEWNRLSTAFRQAGIEQEAINAGEKYYVEKGYGTAQEYKEMLLSNARYLELLNFGENGTTPERLTTLLRDHSISTPAERLAHLSASQKSKLKLGANNLYDRFLGGETISKEELLAVPGIGEATADKILRATQGSPVKGQLATPFLRSALHFNKRQQIFFNNYYRVDRGMWNSVAPEDQLRPTYILAKDYVDYKPDFEAETSDGAVVMRDDLLQANLKAAGLPLEGGHFKPFIMIRDEKGALLGKLAVHGAGASQSAHLKEQGIGMIIRQSSAKQAGQRIFHESHYDGEKFTWTIDGKQVKPTIYSMNPEEMHISWGTYDNAAAKLNKGTRIPLPMLTHLTPEQVTPEQMTDIREFFLGHFAGKAEYNEQLFEYLRHPEKNSKLLDTLKDHIDEIGIKELATAFSHPNARKLRQVVRQHVIKSEAGFSPDKKLELERDDVLPEYMLSQVSGALRLLKMSDGSDGTALMKSLRKLNEGYMMQYFVRRITSPKLKHSGKAIMVPYDDALQLLIPNLKEDEFYLGNAFKKERIQGIDGNGNERSMTLEEQFRLYEGLQKGGKHTALVEAMADRLRAVVVRMPMEDLSGAAHLKFAGFTGRDGGGVLLHARTMKRLGGADLDIDTASFFFGLPRSYREALDAHSKPFYEVLEQPKELPPLEDIFVRQAAELPLYNHPLGLLDSVTRAHIGHAVSKGRGEMLPLVVNMRQHLHALYSTANKQPDGRFIATAYSANNRPTNYRIAVTARKDNGQLLRSLSAIASNTAADVGGKGGMVSPMEMKAILAGAAFEKIESWRERTFNMRVPKSRDQFFTELAKLKEAGQRTSWTESPDGIRTLRINEKVEFDMPEVEQFLKATYHGFGKQGLPKSLYSVVTDKTKFEGITPREYKKLSANDPMRYPPEELPAVKKAYKDHFNNAERPFTLYDTELKFIAALKNKLYGKNYNEDRRWNMQEVSEAITFMPDNLESPLRWVAETIGTIPRMPSHLDLLLNSPQDIAKIYQQANFALQTLAKDKLFDFLGFQPTIPYKVLQQKAAALAPHYMPNEDLIPGVPNLAYERGITAWAEDPELLSKYLVDIFDKGAMSNVSSEVFKRLDVKAALDTLSPISKSKLLGNIYALQDKGQVKKIVDSMNSPEWKALPKEVQDGVLSMLRANVGVGKYDFEVAHERRRFIKDELTKVEDFVGNDLGVLASAKVMRQLQEAAGLGSIIIKEGPHAGKSMETVVLELARHAKEQYLRMLDQRFISDTQLMKMGEERITDAMIQNMVHEQIRTLAKGAYAGQLRVQAQGGDSVSVEKLLDYYYGALYSDFTFGARASGKRADTQSLRLGADIVPRHILQLFGKAYEDAFTLVSGPASRATKRTFEKYFRESLYQHAEEQRLLAAPYMEKIVFSDIARSSEVPKDMRDLVQDITDIASSYPAFVEEPRALPEVLRSIYGVAQPSDLSKQQLEHFRNLLITWKTGPGFFNWFSKGGNAVMDEVRKNLKKKGIEFSMRHTLQFQDTTADELRKDDLVLLHQRVFNEGALEADPPKLWNITTDGKLRQVYGDVATPISHFHELITYGNAKNLMTQQANEADRSYVEKNIAQWVVGGAKRISDPTKNDIDTLQDLAIRLYELNGAEEQVRRTKRRQNHYPNSLPLREAYKKALQDRKVFAKWWMEVKQDYDFLKDEKFRITSGDQEEVVTGAEIIKRLHGTLEALETRGAEKVYITPDWVKKFVLVRGEDVVIAPTLLALEKNFRRSVKHDDMPFDGARLLSYEQNLERIADDSLRGSAFERPSEDDVRNWKSITFPHLTDDTAVDTQLRELSFNDKELDMVAFSAVLRGLRKPAEIESLIRDVTTTVGEDGLRKPRTELSDKQIARVEGLKTAEELVDTMGAITPENPLEGTEAWRATKKILRYYNKRLDANEDVPDIRTTLFGMSNYSQFDYDMKLAQGKISPRAYLKHYYRDILPFRPTGKLPGYFPHGNYKESIVRKEQQKMAEEASPDMLPRLNSMFTKILYESKTPDASLNSTEADLILRSHASIEALQQLDANRVTGNMLTRKILLNGYERSLNAYEDYMRKINNATYNNLSALLMNNTIARFEQRQSMGALTPRWAQWMRIYARDVMGYPSIFSEDVIDTMGKKFKRTPYYLLSDQAIFNKFPALRKIFAKVKGKTELNPFEYLILKNNLGHAPTEEDIAKAEGVKLDLLTKTTGSEAYDSKLAAEFGYDMASFANLEARYEMATLLFHSKTGLSNILFGEVNNLVWNGASHAWAARDIKTWRKIQMKKADNPKEVVETMSDVYQVVSRWGVMENFITYEGNILAPTARKGRFKEFMNAVIKKVEKDPEMEDAKLIELAKDYGIDESFLNTAGFFMRKSERLLRTHAFLSGYLARRAALEPLPVPYDSADLIDAGKRSIAMTQFLYDAPNRPAFARTSLGQVMSRFKLWAWQSVKFRRHVIDEAFKAGYTPGSPEFDRFQRMAIADLFMVGLASLLPFTLFDYSLPAPYSWFQSLADWALGDDKERERAFFISSFGLPVVAAPLAELLPPLARLPKGILDSYSTFDAIFSGQVNRLGEYTTYSLFPFGRMAKDVARAYDNPALAFEVLSGVPLMRISRAKNEIKKRLEAQENADNIDSSGNKEKK